MLFDTYIVMILNDFLVKTSDDDDEIRETYELRGGDDVTLLAVDLRDNSVQEVQIHDRLFFFDEKRNESPSYTLTKYGDNQIIKYGLVRIDQPLMTLITIESFYRIDLLSLIYLITLKAFTVKCEDITTKETPKIYLHTAQISNDFLYVYGGLDKKKMNHWIFPEKKEKSDKEKESNVWRFDLSKKNAVNI